MAGTGGYRPGAGRKKGGRNTLTQKMIEAASLTGLLPHQILLEISRTGLIEHHGQSVKVDLDTRIDCIKAAANYYAPKLAQIDQQVESTNDFVISGEPLSKEEFDKKYLTSSEDGVS